MKRRATIKDVAERAGVSKAAVSYVLNDIRKVSAETKARVLQAASELDYQPDFTARSLTKRTSNMIGVILPLVDASIANVMQENTYYNEMISAIEKVARENGFDVLLTGLARPEEYRNWVQKRRLDGLLFLGLFPASIYAEMRSMEVPAVLIDTYEEHTGKYPSVNINDEKGGFLAAEHLLSLGHENIAFLTTGLENPVEVHRYKGFTRAFQERGMTVPSPETAETTHRLESGWMIGKKLAGSSRTAIVCTSDITAFGVIRALYEAGVRVPEDVSVTGFDDIHISRYTTPSLTTVRQHIMQKGTAAAEKLIETMKGHPAAGETFDVKLVIRESTAPPKQ
ncbi:LacI family DNA-binding transcriptional regulator [Alkalicoccus urumqiensis]|uniref:LacI family transcriptional regulator n=1 Tax=Alkalicoccus urumqiensis TaxID=1548213 RepID=A0A2P6MI33_ALKUR|nr:LacI family DNA-binding transcriptional regulator [Alkalicoccus urumqiensis]PRO65945.1 LacI family transcriptional regulator [Alkalicoccus urumqiensis]